MEDLEKVGCLNFDPTIPSKACIALDDTLFGTDCALAAKGTSALHKTAAIKKMRVAIPYLRITANILPPVISSATRCVPLIGFE